jgi:translation initiation factor IF-2
MERNAALAKARKRVSLEDITKILEQGRVEQLNLILKGDVSGSVEALRTRCSRSTSARRSRCGSSGAASVPSPRTTSTSRWRPTR